MVEPGWWQRDGGVGSHTHHDFPILDASSTSHPSFRKLILTVVNYLHQHEAIVISLDHPPESLLSFTICLFFLN